MFNRRISGFRIVRQDFFYSQKNLSIKFNINNRQKSEFTVEAILVKYFNRNQNMIFNPHAISLYLY